MSSLFGILNSGAGAIRVNQRDLATVGNNIANAQTPGYTRQQLVRRAVDGPNDGKGAVGNGVDIDVIERVRDRFAEREYLAGREASSFADSRASWLSQVEAPFDETTTSGVGDAIGSFFNSLRTLTATPNDTAARTAVRDAADAVGKAFARASDGLDAVSSGVNSALPDMVGEANSLAARIAALNSSIQRSEGAGGGPANDLRDQRDEAARQLIEKTGGQILESSQGVTVLVGGRALVDGDRAGTLDTQNAAAGTRVVFRDSSGQTTDVTSLITRGKIGAALEVRDTVVAGLRTKLDSLAYDLATRVNEVHRAGVGKDGVGGRDLFTPLSGAPGAAKSLTVSAAVLASTDAIAASGSLADQTGNLGATALAALDDEGRPALAGQRMNGYYASLAGEAGRQAADANGMQQAEMHRLDQVSALREQVSGVTLDEEMAKVITLQASFAAAAKVVTTVDQMLQTILNMKV